MFDTLMLLAQAAPAPAVPAGLYGDIAEWLQLGLAGVVVLILLLKTIPSFQTDVRELGKQLADVAAEERKAHAEEIHHLGDKIDDLGDEMRAEFRGATVHSARVRRAAGGGGPSTGEDGT